MYILVLTGVRKNVKTTQILSIRFFQVASNRCIKYINQKFSFAYEVLLILYIIKMQVLKARLMKNQMKEPFLTKNTEILLGFFVIL